MRIFKNKPLVLTLVIMLLIFALPVLLLAQSRPTETESDAAKSTTLYFSPASTTVAVGERTKLNLMINPGSNLVAMVKIEVKYDPAKLKPSPTAVTVNKAVFPVILEGPIVTSGRIRMTLAVGSDPTKVVKQTSRVATFNFSPIATTNKTVVSLGANTTVNSIALNDGFSENVLSTTIPAAIRINRN